MNVDKFIAKLDAMKVSEAKAIAARIKALPDRKRSLTTVKLLCILMGASDNLDPAKIKAELEAKAVSAMPRDTENVRFC